MLFFWILQWIRKLKPARIQATSFLETQKQIFEKITFFESSLDYFNTFFKMAVAAAQKNREMFAIKKSYSIEVSGLLILILNI